MSAHAAVHESGPGVLLIEDDHSIGRLVRSYLERSGYRVVWVRSGEEGMIELGRRMIQLHEELWPGQDVTVEMRPLFGPPTPAE